MVIACTIYRFNRTAIGIGMRVSFVIGYNHWLIHHQLGSSFRACTQLPFMEIMRARSCAPKLSGSGFISARISEFFWVPPFCYMRAYIVTPINMLFSY